MGANLNGRRLSLYELRQPPGLAPPSHGCTIAEKALGLPSHLLWGSCGWCKGSYFKRGMDGMGKEVEP